MSEEPLTPKRELARYVFCGLAFFALTMMRHPVIDSFYYVNLAVVFYCIYRAGRAAIAMWRE